ncbi:MAG TPA: biotin/lipoyl-containing protein, partial [Gemmataceae bacterium]
MPVEQVKVPRAGESITEATINRWLKADGAFVNVDEPLFELGTDKATQEVPAPVAGVLKILAKEGATVAVDSVVAEINTQASGGRESAIPASGKSTPAAPPPGPAATRLLAEAGLKPSEVAGTAPGGRVTKGDVIARTADSRPPLAEPTRPPLAANQRTTREPMSQIRRRIAERLLASQNATATLTTFNEADLSNLMELRTRYNDRFEK